MSDYSSHQRRMFSPSLDAMMKEVLHTLSKIDFEHEVEMEKVEKSPIAEELGNCIRETLSATHRERRQPYVDLLNKLWMQQHGQSFAA